jgi:hypothetical protein
MITDTMPAGQLAALDQAIAAYRAACRGFAHMTTSGTGWAESEARLRNAGFDAATGLTTIPVAAVRFADVRADGARVRAINGSIQGGEVWMCWAGRSLPCGIESREYGAWDLIQVKASI